MMNNISFYITLFLCLLLNTSAAWGQDYKEMRAEIIEKQENTRTEIDQLTNQIQKYEERLELADQKYEALYEKYQNLKNLIALQDQKLKKLQEEQSQIEEEIEVTTQSLSQTRQELQTLIEDYKQTLSYLYKHGQTSQLALIFSAASINHMLVRSFYLEKFNNYREQQAEQIRATQQELEQTQQQLVEAQSKNEDVLTDIRNEKEQLAEQRKQQEQNVNLLQQNRSEIKSELQQAQEEKEQLNNTLSELVREEEKIREAQEERLRRREAARKQKLAEAQEIENESERAEEVAKYSEPIESADFLNSEKLAEIEAQFANSKGQLSWPVESRTISERFGNRRHPVYGTITPNPGIEIVTDSAETVRSVHPGYVIAVQPFAGYGDVVLLKHGRFITAYGNLSQIRVRKNQILEEGDIIGLAGDIDSPKGESLFFLIRENNNNLDPENWLRQQTASSNP